MAHFKYEHHHSIPHRGGVFVAATCSHGQFVSLGAAASQARRRTHQDFVRLALVSLHRCIGGNRITDQFRKQWCHFTKVLYFTSFLDSVGRREYRLSDSPVSAEARTQMMTADQCPASSRPAGQSDGSDDLSCPVRYVFEHLGRIGSCSYLTEQAIVATDRAFPAVVAR
jgi:hypothetical protein